MIVVAADGTGDYRTIQQAVDAAPTGTLAPVLIRVKLGEYREKLVIHKSNLRIVGDVTSRTVIVFGDHAKQLDEQGAEKGTFLSYTTLITGHDIELERLTIRNDAGDGREKGQAVALYAAGDRLTLHDCCLDACQDTLFCGPTTPKVASDCARPVPALAASASDAPPLAYKQYFERCEIRGDVDFIFGSYVCLFTRCKLVCKNRDLPVNGWYTAANTPEEQALGFVFDRCHFTGEHCADGTVYLGRPWRKHARTALFDCTMDACVHPAGWMDWDKEKPVTDKYREYGASGTTSRHPRARTASEPPPDETHPRDALGGFAPWRAPRALYLCGDSTLCAYDGARRPRTGWGEALGAYFHGYMVVNEAMSGRSSKSFVDEARLAHIEHFLRPGDVLFIQFGHNDEHEDAERHTEPYGTFTDYLTMFVDAARMRGALPVIATPIARRRFDAQGHIADTHGAYAQAVRALSASAGVPLIDACAITAEQLEALGDEGSARLYMSAEDDATHLSAEGARAVASWLSAPLKAFLSASRMQTVPRGYDESRTMLED